MKRNDAESRLQMAVVQHLRLGCKPGIFWFSVPNEGKRAPRTANRLKAMGMVPGVPDIVIIINGIAHGLELKAKGGHQSTAQRDVEAAWTAAGGFYACTTGIDETLATLVRWGVLPETYLGRPKPQELPLEGVA